MNIAERDALVLEALPLVRKLCRTYSAVRRLEYAPVISDGYYSLFALVDEYDAEKGRGDWLRFVTMRLRHRLVDLHRARVGRERGAHFASRLAIRYPLSIEEFAERAESDEAWWPEPLTCADSYDEVDTVDALESFAARLDDRRREMLALRLVGYQLSEIGDVYGITESRVSQIFAAMRPALERALAA